VKAEQNVSDHILPNLLVRIFTHRSAFPGQSTLCPLELLAQLKLTDVTDRIRLATEQLYQELIDAGATAFIGAAPLERSTECSTHRNGSRLRTLTTTVGDLELTIPKLRQGTFFPALLERRRRVDQGLFAVVMEAYLHGVSTRKVDDLVKALGADPGISKSEVSRICAGLDEEVSQFQDRDLAALDFPYLFLDAIYRKSRVNHRVMSQAVVVTVGVAAKSSASTSKTPKTRLSGPSS
jgi:putative transposase